MAGVSEKNHPAAAPLTSDEIDRLIACRSRGENIHAITDRVLATLASQRDDLTVLLSAASAMLELPRVNWGPKHEALARVLADIDSKRTRP